MMSESVKEATVTVEMCEERKPSLHIKNMGSHCDEALLEYHFSDPKRSGGGEIEEIQMIGTNEAIITFVDPTGKHATVFGGYAMKFNATAHNVL